MGRYKTRYFIAVLLLLGVPALMGAAPALLQLIARVDILEAESGAVQQQVEDLEAESALLLQENASLRAESDMEPVVIDANGNRVGTVITQHTGGGNPNVMFDLDGFDLFSIYVRPNRLEGQNAAKLRFESDDCSGVPLMRPRGETFTAPRAFVHEVRNDLPIFLDDRNPANAFEVLTGSFMGEGSSSCIPANNTYTVAPAIPLFVWQDEFTPPFKVVTLGKFLAMQGGNQ